MKDSSSKKYFIFLGAPGSGKGTQAQNLAKHIDISQISTGDLVRSEISAGTENAKRIQKFLGNGELVPDDLMIDIFTNNIKQSDLDRGFVIDGYPRTFSQASSLDEFLGDKAEQQIIYLKVNVNALLDRILNRKICTNCNRIYNISTNPPKVDGVCDACSGSLATRSDDNEDTLKTRHTIFQSRLEPILAYYGDRVSVIDGDRDVDAVFQDIKGLI